MVHTFVIGWRILTTLRNWPVYIFNRLGLLRGTVTYRLRGGMTLHARPFAIDRSPINDVWIDLSYEPNTYGIPFDWSACKTIVDIGGHIGTFMLYAASKAPQATIHAFEPEPSNAAMLRENIAINGLQNRVHCHQLGLGSGRESILHVEAQRTGGHSLILRAEGSRDVPVQTATLRQMFDENNITRCDFLKMDCEGPEYEAFYTLPPEYFERIRFLALEYHYFSPDPRHTPEALIPFLELQGFTVKKHRKSMLMAYRR